MLGALVGIAVGQGRIGSVGDPITRYWYTETYGGRRTTSPTPDLELVTAWVGISVGNLDTGKEMG